MSDIIKPGGYNPSPYPSPNIWADCNFKELQEGDGGWAVFEDFFAPTAKTNATTATPITDHFTVALSTDSTAGPDTALPHALKLNATSANEISAWVLGFGSTTFTGQTVRLAYHTTKFWFETRMKLVTVAEIATFVGLFGKAGTMGVAATVLDNTTGVPDNDNVNFIGFNSIIASPTLINAMYLKEDESAQTNVKASAHTAVADTFYRVGMKFDGEYLCYYVNGALVGSPVHLTSSALPSTFPDQSVGLTLAGISKNSSTTDRFTTYDWIKAAYQTPL